MCKDYPYIYIFKIHVSVKDNLVELLACMAAKEVDVDTETLQCPD